MSASEDIIRIAKEIRARLDAPRLFGWWIDIEDLCFRFEEKRRELHQPEWLPERQANIEALSLFDGFARTEDGKFWSLAEDPKWKPGIAYDPDCFLMMSISEKTVTGEDVVVGVRAILCDPWQKTFELEEMSFPEDLSEHPAELSRLREDAKFCIDSWIRYLSSDEDPWLGFRPVNEYQEQANIADRTFRNKLKMFRSENPPRVINRPGETKGDINIRQSALNECRREKADRHEPA